MLHSWKFPDKKIEDGRLQMLTDPPASLIPTFQLLHHPPSSHLPLSTGLGTYGSCSSPVVGFECFSINSICMLEVELEDSSATFFQNRLYLRSYQGMCNVSSLFTSSVGTLYSSPDYLSWRKTSRSSRKLEEEASKITSKICSQNLENVSKGRSAPNVLMTTVLLK